MRDFTYIKDTIDAMIKALETENIEGEIINIVTSKTQKMKHILSLIKKETNSEEKPLILDKNRLRPRDVENLVTNNTKARNALKWAPKTTKNN